LLSAQLPLPFPNALLGKPIADRILEDVRQETKRLIALGHPPRLVSVTIGDTDPVAIYVRNQELIADSCGISFTAEEWPQSISSSEAMARLRELSEDKTVTGLILQRPVPRHLSVQDLQMAISPMKDVEGMHPESIGNIVYGKSRIGPCTALASVEMLRSTGLKLEGLEVVVIGHSEIVGKPIAFMLMAEGATVTVCHHMTRNLAHHAIQADAVFVAVGKPHLVGASMIKKGAAVIDIGINQIVDSMGKKTVVGDVDRAQVQPIAGWLTPVPRGVGPVTVAMLMRNSVRAAEDQWRA
jgi:methylenetetrahydrofolate dehydrogenase (NADP+)/methenyltetrahydrofolate cyclohydrolase